MSDTPPVIIPAQPGFDLADYLTEDSDRRVVGIESVPIIAWRIEQRRTRDGDWTEAPTTIPANDFCKLRAVQHPVIRYPKGRMVTFTNQDLRSEQVVITHFQKVLDRYETSQRNFAAASLYVMRNFAGRRSAADDGKE